MTDPDAVVIGSGPNGLVAANILASAGWSVLVLEEQPEPGGAVRSAELTEPGFRHDLMSAFYPFAAASPVVRALGLERHGLRWCRGPLVLAHPSSDGSCVVLSRDLDETCESLDSFAPGDGGAWRELYRLWQRTGASLLEGMTRPLPPLRAAAGLTAALGPHGLLRFARFALLSLRRLATEQFRGDGAARLLAGNALHTDLMPESALSGFFGWFLTALGQDVGFPFPEGGAGRLAEALVARLEAGGGRVRCGTRVVEVVVRRRTAVGVRLADGTEIGARRAVLAGCDAPQLFLELLAREHVPARTLADLRRFEWDPATVKVDWALDAPIEWASPDVARAPVVHVADGLDALHEYASDLARRRIPSRPFLVFGQYSIGDATRAPAGKEAAWAYTHVPRGAQVDARYADVMEEQVERLAPGFGELVRARHVLTPHDLQARNRNLSDGALNGGTAQLHQQLVFRPVVGLGRPETPIARLYLASSSAHPGGGVHGGPGAIAARAALHASRRTRIALGTAVALTAAGSRPRSPSR